MKQLLFNALLLASICPMSYGMQQVAIKPPVQTGTYFTPRKIVGGVIIGAIGVWSYLAYRKYRLENKLLAEYCLRDMAGNGGVASLQLALTRVRKWNADINAAGSNGNTALMRALARKEISIIRLLLEHGAQILFNQSDVRSEGIYMVCQTYDSDIVRLFAADNAVREELKVAAVNITDREWRNRVHVIIADAEAKLAVPGQDGVKEQVDQSPAVHHEAGVRRSLTDQEWQELGRSDFQRKDLYVLNGKLYIDEVDGPVRILRSGEFHFDFGPGVKLL